MGQTKRDPVLLRPVQHECGDEDTLCAKCCEHHDRDGTECLDCGSDITEWLVMRAEAAFEGDR